MGASGSESSDADGPDSAAFGADAMGFAAIHLTFKSELIQKEEKAYQWAEPPLLPHQTEKSYVIFLKLKLVKIIISDHTKMEINTHLLEQCESLSLHPQHLERILTVCVWWMLIVKYWFQLFSSRLISKLKSGMWPQLKRDLELFDGPLILV